MYNNLYKISAYNLLPNRFCYVGSLTEAWSSGGKEARVWRHGDDARVERSEGLLHGTPISEAEIEAYEKGNRDRVKSALAGPVEERLDS